jgi:predicted dinucleotide-binding enzyme
MIRVLVAGDVALARALRDAGAEVIFIDGTPDQLATTALQEDVDAIAVPREHRAAVAAALAANDASEIVLATVDETTAEELVQHVR